MATTGFGTILRAIAIVSLVMALTDAARILGVSETLKNPMLHYGIGAFVVAAALTLIRLFASVGLWIGASWGAVLLVGGTATELAIRTILPESVRWEWPELAIRLLLAICIAAIYGYQLWHARESIHE